MGVWGDLPRCFCQDKEGTPSPAEKRQSFERARNYSFRDQLPQLHDSANPLQTCQVERQLENLDYLPIHKLWHIHSLEWDLEVKNNASSLHKSIWINLKNKSLSKNSLADSIQDDTICVKKKITHLELRVWHTQLSCHPQFQQPKWAPSHFWASSPLKQLGQYQRMTQIPVPLPHMWESQKKLLAFCFCLTQPWLLWSFGKWTDREKTCIYPPLSNSVFQVSKIKIFKTKGKQKSFL